MGSLFSLLDAETAHNLAIWALEKIQRRAFIQRFIEKRFSHNSERLTQKICGLDFPNPVGLAAGWDKNARVPKALAALGFGFLEVGTVTLKPEAGNPRPRIWRSFKEQWLLNRVGFANDGAKTVAERLKKQSECPRDASQQDSAATRVASAQARPSLSRGSKGRCILGVSLGKNIVSDPNELAGEAVSMMELFYPYVNFFVLNVSSPNTPQRFELERPEFLVSALDQIQKENLRIAANIEKNPRPLFVKIGPIPSQKNLQALADVFLQAKVNGLVATNTLPTQRGGLSGRPLRELALKTTAQLYLALEGKIPIIGVGGILTPEDAWERIRSGARLIELFSAFVFYGPNIIQKILEYLNKQMTIYGLKSLEEACGVRAKEFAGK